MTQRYAFVRGGATQHKLSLGKAYFINKEPNPNTTSNANTLNTGRRANFLWKGSSELRWCGPDPAQWGSGCPCAVVTGCPTPALGSLTVSGETSVHVPQHWRQSLCISLKNSDKKVVSSIVTVKINILKTSRLKCNIYGKGTQTMKRSSVTSHTLNTRVGTAATLR